MRYYTTKEVASKLGFKNHVSIRTLVKRGRIKVIRNGKYGNYIEFCPKCVENHGKNIHYLVCQFGKNKVDTP